MVKIEFKITTDNSKREVEVKADIAEENLISEGDSQSPIFGFLPWKNKVFFQDEKTTQVIYREKILKRNIFTQIIAMRAICLATRLCDKQKLCVMHVLISSVKPSVLT